MSRRLCFVLALAAFACGPALAEKQLSAQERGEFCGALATIGEKAALDVAAGAQESVLLARAEGSLASVVWKGPTYPALIRETVKGAFLRTDMFPEDYKALVSSSCLKNLGG